MNIRQAILKAADHIASNPSEFNWGAIGIPTPACGSPGCALGWIGFFAGHRPDTCGFSRVCPSMSLPITSDIDHGEFAFYKRMDEIDTDWRFSADSCADSLRTYADKYYPAESRALIPDSVARIFRMSHAELARKLETA